MVWLIIIYILLLSGQMLAGFLAFRQRSKYLSFKNKYLSNKVNFSDVLELYKKEIPNLQLKAVSNIKEPAFAESNFLLINKKFLGAKDLFSTLYLIFQAELTRDRNSFLRSVNIYQNIIFVFQLLIFLISIVVDSALASFGVIVAILLNILLIGLTLYASNIYKERSLDFQYIATGLLQLDDVESARSEDLLNKFQSYLFEYPLELAWRIITFFTP